MKKTLLLGQENGGVGVLMKTDLKSTKKFHDRMGEAFEALVLFYRKKTRLLPDREFDELIDAIRKTIADHLYLLEYYRKQSK